MEEPSRVDRLVQMCLALRGVPDDEPVYSVASCIYCGLPIREWNQEVFNISWPQQVVFG